MSGLATPDSDGSMLGLKLGLGLAFSYTSEGCEGGATLETGPCRKMAIMPEHSEGMVLDRVQSSGECCNELDAKLRLDCYVVAMMVIPFAKKLEWSELSG